MAGEIRMKDRNEGGVEESGRGAAAALAGGSALRCSRRTWNSELIQENRHALLDALDVISGGLQLRLEFRLDSLQRRFHSAKLLLRSVEVCLDIIKTFGEVAMNERSAFYKNIRSVLYKAKSLCNAV